jgi:RNA recognition motif-containing protein
MATKLFIGNLSYKSTDEDLKNLFSEAGTVTSASVIMDRMTNRSRGFGFVEMANDEEAQAAIAKFQGYDLDGRAINVNEAREREDRPRTGGGDRDRGGDRGGYRN